ncbi:hypothetical protein EBR43_06005 [bacterium]|nr:hypothetical protein [bacterium]
MSFETLKVAELREIAENFAVDTDGIKSKANIIAALAEEGVTWSVYQKTLDTVKEANEDAFASEEVLPRLDTKSINAEDTVLVRMTRENFRYDILGFTFTKEHPFVAMNENQAQEIFDKEEGFRLATPKEVQEYYG